MADFSEFKPASKAEAAAAAAPAAPAPAAVEPASAPAAPAAPVAPIAAPRYVGGKVLPYRVALDYPIEFGGRTYQAITLRRTPAAEVGLFFERLVERGVTDTRAILHFPIFVDDDGAPIPDEVLAFLDGDDEEAVMERAGDFLCARFRRFREALQPVSPPAAGEPTGPTSSTS